ncbi:MAG TPA: hypothetical protein PLC09_01990 [Holophaga sp.]|nr:hypothetical protein [Holophaga sp.]
MAALTAVGVLTLGCGGKDDKKDPVDPGITLSGTVTYTRIPVVKDASGVPTGLESDTAKFTSQPARSVIVRVFQGSEETLADGSKVMVWATAAVGPTDRDGKYSLTVPTGKPTFVELVSTLQYTDSSNTTQAVRLLGNADGIASSTPVTERPLYGLRKKPDGSAVDNITTPGQVPALAAAATVNFSVGVDTRWLLVYTQATRVAEAAPEPGTTGSRALAILDDGFAFADGMGSPTPGGTLYLHYCPGVDAPKGTYVEYDRDAFPASYDGVTRNFMGSIRGGSANDDAWDQALLFHLYARNRLYAARQETYPQMPFPVSALADRANHQHLSPDLALVEGFSQGMTALLLKSPYLADTHAGGATVVDVDHPDAALGADAYSAAHLADLFWELALKANNIAAPGTPDTWKNLNSAAVRRLWSLSTTDKGGASAFTEIPNVWIQLGRLKEAKDANETVDLAAIFTDAVLTQMAGAHGITWPRPTTGAEARFLKEWPKNPDLSTNALPAFSLSMAGAQADGEGRYPNHSKGEVVYGRFQLDRDRIYEISFQTDPALPAGAELELMLGAQIYRFAPGTEPLRLPLTGTETTLVTYPIRVRVLSPTAVQPDLQVTLRFAPQN